MTLLPKYWRLLAVAFLALATVPEISPAQTNLTATAGMVVGVEIVAACTVSVADLDFGAYASNSKTPVQGQTTIQLRCGAGAVAELSLDAGSGPGATTSNRRLEQDSGRSRLDYDLFQDPGRTIHWGNRSGVDTLEVVATGAQQTVPIYGQIPSGQRALEGTYSDTITLRVQY